MGQKVSGYLRFSLSGVCGVYVYMLFYRWKSVQPTDNKTVIQSAVIHRNVTAEVVVHIGGRAVGTVDFQLHAEHQRSTEGRIAEIRGKKKKSGQYKTNTCSFPGEKSCHCTPLATPKGEGKFTLRQGFRRMKQSRITTATSAGITGLVSLGSLAVLGTIFEKLNRCVWNVLFLSGI